MAEQYRRRVGSVRPSHLMFTSGIGALVDLPNISVLVCGVDDWNYSGVPGDGGPIAEPRLLAAVQTVLGNGAPNAQVKELRPAPWLPGLDQNSAGPAARVGVPTTPFPTWLRCTACNLLAPLESREFRFENDKARRPQDARFVHDNCKRKGKRPLAVAARFVLCCTAGHLDDFPYALFVHRGGPCEKAVDPRFPQLRMDDRGGNLGANVDIQCINCKEHRNIRDAQGKRAEHSLPRCRARHPHLATFDPAGCDQESKLLVVGASNQWFPQTLSALAVPRTSARELDATVEQHWPALATLPLSMYPYARENVLAFRELVKWTDNEIAAAVERVRAALKSGEPEPASFPDLRTPEWETFSAEQLPERGEDFALRRDPEGVPTALKGFYADVVHAERLREVRALIGFTRLDAPDPDDPDLVTRVALSRDQVPPWVPASEVRGEGIFLRLPEDVLSRWEQQITDSHALRLHQQAYARFRENRYSGRITGPFDPMRLWPGARYLALHTLSHLLIRTISLECGYSAASLAERIYAGTTDEPRSGILIYTAVPDAEGTLGGLVSLAQPDSLIRLTRRALSEARRCSSDPLCAERLPHAPADFLHGAACHVCLFVSETTCERGNRFLDRRFIVPIDDPQLALFSELP